MSKERPIILGGPMVRAILNGAKTQTRRVIKPQPDPEYVKASVLGPWGEFENTRESASEFHADGSPVLKKWSERCPDGQSGDRLWVRETWAKTLAVSPATDEAIWCGPGERIIEPPTCWTDSEGRERWHYDGELIVYRASSNIEFCDGDGFRGDLANREDMPRWRPSIHMPRAASRLTLEIAEVRVHRLQDITEEDAIAEGLVVEFGGWTMPEWDRTFDSPIQAFRHLWENIDGAGNWRDHPWDSNPWLWAVTFRKIETEVKP